MSAGRVVVLMAAVTVAFMAATGAVSFAFEESAERVTVDNESFTPDGTVTLNDSNLAGAQYDQNVSVFNNSRSTEYTSPGNYTWNDGNGTLEVVANSQLDNQSTARIDYGYFQHSETGLGMVALWGDLADMGAVLPLALAVAAVFAAVTRFQ